MFEKPPRYYTYILRFWEERDETADTRNWRYTLHDTENDTRYGFTSLEEVSAFLEKRTALTDKAATNPPTSKQQPE
jgi:hypothetical protein